MNYQGILFTPESILAILSGSKTQTRRRTLEDRSDCQYGKVGDLLYIKEDSETTAEQSRVWLEITSVRLERIKSISKDDIRSEGFKSKKKFSELWNKFYGEMTGYSWEENPLVWVIKFRVVHKNDQ